MTLSDSKRQDAFFAKSFDQLPDFHHVYQLCFRAEINTDSPPQIPLSHPSQRPLHHPPHHPLLFLVFHLQLQAPLHPRPDAYHPPRCPNKTPPSPPRPPKFHTISIRRSNLHIPARRRCFLFRIERTAYSEAESKAVEIESPLVYRRPRDRKRSERRAG